MPNFTINHGRSIMRELRWKRSKFCKFLDATLLVLLVVAIAAYPFVFGVWVALKVVG